MQTIQPDIRAGPKQRNNKNFWVPWCEYLTGRLLIDEPLPFGFNMSHQAEEVNVLRHLVAGSFGGIAFVLVGQPFDLIKVLLQTTNESQNLRFVITNVLKNEGIRGFYKGVSSVLMGITPATAISFWGFALGQQFFSFVQSQTVRDFLAGGFSGIICTPLVVPLERIKLLMQTNTEKKNLTAFEAAKRIYSENGLISFYRGTFFSVLRDFPSDAVYFGTYFYLKRKLMDSSIGKNNLSLVAILAGGIAGSLTWLIVIPADTIKNRYQVIVPFKSYSSTIADIYKQSGIKGFTRGLSPAMLRAFPANSACFLGYEYSLRAINFLSNNN